MPSLVTLVFALTYIGMALGRVPGLKLDRVGISLIALVVLLAGEAVAVGDLGAAIDAPTLILLFALMILSAQFGAARLYEWCASRITRAQGSPYALLALTVVASGLLSAVLANDIVVFAMTPLLCLGIRRRGLDPRPFLAALAGASNAGSAATIIGNPQNILIGQVGGLDFWTFLIVCGAPALLALGITYGVVALVWRAELSHAANPMESPDLPPLDRWQLAKAGLGTAALILLFATSLPREIGALVIAAFLLLSRRMHSRDMVGAVDWPLLLLFACLFVITHAFAETGLAREAIAALGSRDLLPETIAVMAPLALLASNSIGNVPFVVLLLAVWPSPSEGGLYGLALLSTLAGNLLLTGSLANIITAERAAAAGVRFGFADHARAGVPLTLASLAVAALWLAVTGWMPWR
ncbi:MAG TPA: SLC13 family permease [Alphaproteobacteria bacterium]|nr:SLC13 family permease [Alphaproteobacteria bacterium]